MPYQDKLPKKDKPIIKSGEWDQIVADAEAAKELLTDAKFKFFRDYLANAQKSVVDYFVKNKIRAVDESVPLTNGGERTLHTTKEDQERELSGQYKFIEQMLRDMQVYVEKPKELQEAEEKGSVTLQSSKEK